jgi:hypothetical protein
MIPDPDMSDFDYIAKLESDMFDLQVEMAAAKAIINCLVEHVEDTPVDLSEYLGDDLLDAYQALMKEG